MESRGVPSSSSHLQQKRFQTKSQSVFETLLRQSSPEDIIRLSLRILPQQIPGCWVSNIEFGTAIRLRLGLPLGIPLPPICACGENSDKQGSHFLKCKLGGEWISRHNMIVHVVATIAKASGFLIQQELPLSIITLRSSNPPPPGIMDQVVTSGDFNTNILANVTITHPFPASTSRITPSMLHPVHFTRLKQSHKINKYQNTARLLGASISPLAMETYGAVGPSFQKFLHLCANAYLQKIFLSRPTPEELHKSVIKRSWRSGTPCALQKANVRLLFSKASRSTGLNQLGQRPHYVDIVEVFVVRIR